jgi:type III restriction enzyme
MSAIENPIINSPFAEPQQHHELDKRGNPTGAIVDKRRRSTYLTPIPAPRKSSANLLSLFELQDVQENVLINQIRDKVKPWRNSHYPHVTKTTRTLLEYWTLPEREKRLFFCQIEALETAIYINEVARRGGDREIEDKLREYGAEANAGLFRIAFKMATGSGKTVVMAMLIAYQSLNKLAYPADTRFSDAFLIVTPGITIRDRLRVLLPSDGSNYYQQRDIVPPSLFEQLHRARIVITNYHAFQLRDTVEASALTKRILNNKGANPFTETPAQMVRRVCRGLGDVKNLIVINDEAHHCYDRKADATDKLDKDDKKDLEERRVWVNGIRAVAEKLGVKVVYDLSATPFFLRGSGYPEGKLFPWVVSDFALIDAIESGIVKIPRLPIADDAMVGDQPIYRDLWRHISPSLPKKRAKNDEQEPELPKQLQGALTTLYESYKLYYAAWEAQEAARQDGTLEGGAIPPPVLIVVCNNTTVSKMVYDWISGYERSYHGETMIAKGALEIFRNERDNRWLPRPNTILVDSQQLESGDGMSDDFKSIARHEIDTFKAEYRQRYPERDPEDLTDTDLLREVMNTVGKPGRLGEHVKCVVSVSMLTEGWDVNGVTHILGVRAFSTQLICEQVVGRALRRMSYVQNDDGMFDPEYAEIFGVPFAFLPAAGSSATPRLPRVPTYVRAHPERANAEFRFPNVIGYRYQFRDTLQVGYNPDSAMTLSSADVPTMTENAPLLGESAFLDLGDLYQRRHKEVVFLLAKEVLHTFFKDEDNNGIPKVWYFPQILAAVQNWLDKGYLTLKDNCQMQLLLFSDNARRAAEKIGQAIIAASTDNGQLLPILHPTAPTGSSSTISFETTKKTYRTSPKKCQVDYIVLDSDWEAHMVQTLEMMPEVLAYVKNDGMNLNIPYTLEGNPRTYVPDFIVRVDVGKPQPLNLIIEVTGIHGVDKEAKASTMRTLWIPAVNALGNYGTWDYIEIRDPRDAQTSIRRQLNQIKMTESR